VIEILDILPRTDLGEVSIVFRQWAFCHSTVSSWRGLFCLTTRLFNCTLVRFMPRPGGWQSSFRKRLHIEFDLREFLGVEGLRNLPPRVSLCGSVPSFLPSSICTPFLEAFTLFGLRGLQLSCMCISLSTPNSGPPLFTRLS